MFRYLYLAGRRNPKEVTISRLPGNVVRISFPKVRPPWRMEVGSPPLARVTVSAACSPAWHPQGNFRYKAGQYVFVNIPSLSLFQWHPFSLSSSPYQDTVMVHIRVLGNWTKALCVRHHVGARVPRAPHEPSLTTGATTQIRHGRQAR